jgi:hypothetical protein
MLCFSCFDPSPSFGGKEKLQHLAPLSAQAAVGCPVPVQRVTEVEGPANLKLFLLAKNAKTLFKSF